MENIFLDIGVLVILAGLGALIASFLRQPLIPLYLLNRDRASQPFSCQPLTGRSILLHPWYLWHAPVLQGWQWCYAATVYYLAGEFDAALQAAKRGGDAIPDNQGWMAAILSALDRPDEAEAKQTALRSRT